VPDKNDSLWKKIADALAKEPAYLLIFGICALFFLTAIGTAVAGVIKNGDPLLFGLALGSVVVSLAAALGAIWLVSRRQVVPPPENVNSLAALAASTPPGPTLAVTLLNVAENMAEALQIGSVLLSDTITTELAELLAMSADWRKGELSARGAEYNALLIRLYERARTSVFATSVPEYHLIWISALGQELLRAHARSGARVTRVFVFDKRADVAPEVVALMRKQAEAGINVLTFFDDENAYQFSPLVSRDFTVIDDGEVIGVTAKIDRETPEARWFLNSREHQPKFAEIRAQLEKLSLNWAAFDKWWRDRGTP
jgi:hypothetical protein